MGSAVVKPLTRRRGKKKPNELVVASANGSKEENAGNLEPNLISKEDTVLTSVVYQTGIAETSGNCIVDNTKSNSRVDLNNKTFAHTEGPNPYDSDEEPYPIKLAREECVTASKSERSLEDQAESCENAESVNDSPCLSSSQLNRLPLPPALRKSIRQTYAVQVTKAASPPDIRSGRKQSENAGREHTVKQLVDSESKVFMHAFGLADEVNPENQDVSRDARTPSPEYDDLEDVKVIDPNPVSCDQPASSPVEGHEYFSEERILSPSEKVGVSINKTGRPAPEKKGEQRLELGHVIFIKPSPSKENISPQHIGGGDVLTDKSGYSRSSTPAKPDLYSLKSDGVCSIKGQDYATNATCESPCDRSPKLNGNTSYSVDPVNEGFEAEAEVLPGCNGDNTIRSSDSFCDVLDDVIGSNASTRTSTTSLNADKRKDASLVKITNAPSMTNPEVEEILNSDEEFMAGLDERFVKRYETKTPDQKITQKPSCPKESDSIINRTLSHSKMCAILDKRDATKSPRHSSSTLSRESEISRGMSPRPGSARLVPKKLPSDCRSLNSASKFDVERKSLSSPRPPSGARSTPAMQEYSPRPDRSNRNQHNSRPPSASVEQPLQKSDKSSTSLRSMSGEKIMQKCDNNQNPGSFSQPRTPPGPSNFTNRPNSAMDSVQKKDSSHTRQRPSSAKQAFTSRDSVEKGTTDETCNRVLSRPPSSKRSSPMSEPNHVLAHSRPRSCKQSTSVSDPTHMIPRPKPTHSRQGSNAGLPRPNTDKRFPARIEQCGEGHEDSRSYITGSRYSETCLRSDNKPSNNGSGESPSTKKNLYAAETLSQGNSPLPTCSRSGSKMTNPSKSFNNTANKSQRMNDIAFQGDDIRYTSSSPRGSVTSADKMMESSSRESISPGLDNDENEDELARETLGPPKYCVGAPRPGSARSSADESRTEDAGTSKTLTNERPASTDVNMSVTPCQTPNSLSQDRIGNIRKQLYDEGLKPAEREGGVAFFIPVTEDGLQPVADSALITERLTKSKKSSLNYEERMLLANVNRQMQLSKRKEFAVKDIRNVRGATSNSDGRDRSKQDDDLDMEFNITN